MNKILTHCLLVLCLLSATAVAEIYKWKDADGKVHYTDNPLEKPDAEKITLQINSYEHVTISDAETASNTSQTKASKRVIMYSTAWCGYCKKAKKYFQENNIAYTEYDIEKDSAARQKYNELGGRGVPVILVGPKRMNGFSVEAFARIYKNE